MAKIAITVALLLPEDIMDKAIDINSQSSEDPIKLNKENCLPHLTLSMGAVEEENLPKIEEILTEIGEKFSKLLLTIDKISKGHSCFEIEDNENLQKLHEEIMMRLSPYFSYDAKLNMCFSPPVVVERTLFWINGFKDNTSFENFYPHITLGISKLNEQKLNIDFMASKLAVCHLGNYCTCRKILFSLDLD